MNCNRAGATVSGELEFCSFIRQLIQLCFPLWISLINGEYSMMLHVLHVLSFFLRFTRIHRQTNMMMIFRQVTWLDTDGAQFFFVMFRIRHSCTSIASTKCQRTRMNAILSVLFPCKMSFTMLQVLYIDICHRLVMDHITYAVYVHHQSYENRYYKRVIRCISMQKKIASSSISIIYSLSLRRTNTSVNIEINTDLCACFHNRKNSRTSTDARSVYEYIQHRKNRNKSGSGWTTQKKKQNSNKHE